VQEGGGPAQGRLRYSTLEKPGAVPLEEFRGTALRVCST
jgi:hypothetical protein